MSDDDTQRAIQFILNQQAQLTVKVDKLTDRVDDIARNVGKLAEAQVRHEGRISQLEDSFRVLVQLARNMDERLDTTNGRLDILTNAQAGLTNAQAGLTNAQAGLANAQAELTNAQAETDRRLGDFISAVEHYITEGRNGGPQG